MSPLHPERFRLHLYAPQPTSEPAAPPRWVQQDGSIAQPAGDIGPAGAERAEAGESRRRPPLDLSRLHRSRVRAAAELARMLFALHEMPRVSWNATHGWLDCLLSPRLEGIYDPLFEDAHDLLAALPVLQDWLDQWATSNDRTARMDPPWAVERNIAPSEVECTAGFIAQRLASEQSLTLAFYTDAGDRTCLTIPPRAALQLPPGTKCQRRGEYITAKEDFAVYATPTGDEVFVPADMAAHRSGLPPADPNRLREFRMTSATRIEPVTPAAEVADDD